MYPNLFYAFKDLFGISLPGLRFINTFGFFVALSFIAAAIVLSKELIRKEREGLLWGVDQMVVIGKPASVGELLLNFILGFVVAYKMIGLFFSDNALTANPQEYIKSTAGNLPAGIILGLVLAGWKWYEKNKQKLPQPQEKKIRIWPHDRVGDLTIYAALFGFLGAKIFNSLETWDDFVKDPLGSLFSFSGLTFYGGLICAALAIWVYARKHGIGFWFLNDAAAPALMLAYALGRIGCQTSGDGDWGIPNSAYHTVGVGKVALANPGDFERITQQYYTTAYASEFHGFDKIPHLAVKAPSWLPDWLFAYPYPHNVVGQGIPIPGCVDPAYCNQLPIPVFPTPFYETIICLGLFFLLWSLRKKLKVPGTLFAVYLFVNGIERFFIEKIRVNSKYPIFLHPTQAEIISFLLVLTGAILFFRLRSHPPKTPEPVNSSSIPSPRAEGERPPGT